MTVPLSRFCVRRRLVVVVSIDDDATDTSSDDVRFRLGGIEKKKFTNGVVFLCWLVFHYESVDYFVF